MPHLQGIDRNQTLQFPPRLDEYISVENPVRFLDVFVDQLDLQAIGFSRGQMLLTMCELQSMGSTS
ncbi:hypothetical protein [Leptolyngbya sp. 'hensonii']|uniref:hypothetical protein n=1 Tax=Leptolyngbya sp. 'hensonii' TaxID=1922337 RepID=UPI001180355B|nr:hypothetical protein [Leptolyngbya sp. 'hensonii']